MNRPESPLDKRRRLARCLPRWLQPAITLLSGLADPDAPPDTQRRPWTPRDQLVSHFATLVAAGALGAYCAQVLLNTPLR